MKIQPKRTACGGEDHSCFIITEYCCNKAKEEIPMDVDSFIYRYLNDDGTICWGSFGEFLVDDVKFCPWCAEPVAE